MKLLILILILTAFLRFFRLDYPNAYVFDEVYHGFTAKEYLEGSKVAWEYWTTPPSGVAYEWTHPPLAKEVMTASLYLVGSTEPWAWRLPGAILGVISVFLIYLLGKKLFDQKVGLMAAFLFSLDGLNFGLSRIGMIDIYLVTFMLASILLLLNNRFFFSTLFLGFAIASKWSALYLLAMLLVLLVKKKTFGKIPYFFIIPSVVYILSYLPFFLLGHNLEQFKNLQQQMWWYHSGLKASHDYSSPWWSWPMNLYPVWFYVQSFPGKTANIFASGNPVLFWIGSGAILVTVWDFLKNKSAGLLVVLLGFFIFWLPWAFSPRIMFLYHFAPSVPFLCLALAYQLNMVTDKKLILTILALVALGFAVYYPVLTGIPLPKDFLNLFFSTNLTKNPF